MPGAGRYADRFLEVVAQGYTPALTDTSSAQLEPSSVESLRGQAYLEDIDTDYDGAQLPKKIWPPSTPTCWPLPSGSPPTYHPS